MRSLRTHAAALAASFAAGLVVAGSAVGAPPLKLVSSDTLKVAAKEKKDDASASIFVINEGTESATVTVRFSASKPTSVTARATGSEPIPAGEVNAVNVKFTGLEDLDKKVAGALVISGGATPVARTVEITPALHPTREWPRDIVLFSLSAGLALGLMTVFWVVGETNFGRLFDPAPGPKWSVDSWATTLTAAGAVFGTVLSSATLPDVPQQIDKDTLVTLNLFFGLLLVAGPFVLQAFRRPSASPLEQEGMAGTNLTLVIAACVIFAAVAGEIATLGLLFWEILGNEWQEVAKWTVLLVEAAAGYYFLVTIPRAAAADWVEIGKKAKEAANRTERKRMRKFARILKAVLTPDEVEDAVHRRLAVEEEEDAEQPERLPVRWSLP
jgi:hypothetical protein